MPTITGDITIWVNSPYIVSDYWPTDYVVPDGSTFSVVTLVTGDTTITVSPQSTFVAERIRTTDVTAEVIPTSFIVVVRTGDMTISVEPVSSMILSSWGAMTASVGAYSLTTTGWAVGFGGLTASVGAYSVSATLTTPWTASVAASFGSYTVTANATQGWRGYANLVAGACTITAETGWLASALKNPAFTVTAGATISWTGRVAAKLPFVTVESSATISKAFSAAAQVNLSVTSDAETGWLAGLQVPDFGVTAYLQNSVNGRVIADLPFVDVTATMSLRWSASVSAALPGFQSVYWSAHVDLPAITVSATWQASSSLTQAYVINTSNAALTLYTNFNFNTVVRVGSKAYGAGSAGMCQLGGSSDNGTAISASFTTTPMDFDTFKHKRLPYCYVATDDPITITGIADDAITGTYASEHGDRRVRLARGPKAHYWALRVRNVRGGRLRVDGMEMKADILERKV